MKNILRLLVVFLLLTTTSQIEVFGQKKTRKMKKADEAFDLEKYSNAIELYKKAYKRTKNRAIKSEIIFKQAECYRMSGKTKQSSNYYKRAIKAKYPDAIIFLKYADVLRMLGKFDAAHEQYTIYLEKCGMMKEEIDKLSQDDIRKVNYIKGEMGLRSCRFALEWKDKPTRYNLENVKVFNSRFNDFSPAFGNSDYSEIYFTSSREGGITNKKDPRNGEPYSDVWFSKLNKKRNWSRPVIISEPINSEGNEGSVFLNKRGTSMYLTQCKVEKKKDLGCGIYISQRNGKLWADPQLLQVKVDAKTSIGHPALNKDESVMIFSSDLSGGYGGKDLWITVKAKRNTWSDPVNLGPLVNSPGDEMFPFLAEDGTLYFASNGHVGMGGFDIYSTYEDENGAYVSPINLKVPVNSPGDDFGMIVERGGEKGYLTSNRAGGKGGDDIYLFYLTALELSVQGVVTDSKTGAILTGTSVQLVGSDGSSNESVTDNTGKYSFTLEPLVSYELTVNRDGYLTKILRETTEGVESSKDFVIDFSVDPVKKEIVLPLIKYDFNKYDLRPESLIDLDRLAEGLLDNPNVVIELKSHTDFIGSNSQNNKLSQQRADTCVSYLVSKGVNFGQLVSKGMGETEPFVIEKEDGRFKVGDVLSKGYIKRILFKKNKEKANQYNRRTSFKVIKEDFVPESTNNK